MPNRNSESNFHLIILIGSKWIWALRSSGITKELFRAPMDGESSWNEARKAVSKSIVGSHDKVQLCLTRQFNWPTGITVEQSVRLKISFDRNVGCQVTLDGESVDLGTDHRLLISDPIQSRANGARRLELKLEFQDSGIEIETERFPVHGVWLRIG